MDESDILQTARLLIAEYGLAARSQAAFRADKAFLQGSIEGEETWKRVAAAIHELQSGPNESQG
jgi:hypothetical protein